MYRVYRGKIFILFVRRKVDSAVERTTQTCPLGEAIHTVSKIERKLFTFNR